MSGFAFALLAGAATGLLTGAGVGGGTLLVLYLTAAAGVAQRQAQGINLLYFIAAAPPALAGHLKHGLVERGLALRAGLCGAAAAALTSWLTGGVGNGFLRRGFGALMLVIGIKELFFTKK